MEERISTSLLLDFYGPLLTERQRQCYALHFEEDMSLSEIAEELSVSRQAVHDNMQRAKFLMDEYEEKLGLIRQHEKRQEVITLLKEKLLQTEFEPEELQNLVAQLEG